MVLVKHSTCVDKKLGLAIHLATKPATITQPRYKPLTRTAND
jgi:hypothetical protein